MGVSEQVLSMISSPSNLVSPSDYWLRAVKDRISSIPEKPVSHSVDRAQSALTSELEALERATLVLKGRMNALRPAFTLTRELLNKVLEQLVLVDPINLRRRYLGWVRVTQVCSHWRNAALAHDALWTTLHIDGREPWAIFLERSKSAALQFFCEPCDYIEQMDPFRSHDKLDEVLRHLNRTGVLHMSLAEYWWPKKLVALAAAPAPVLEELQLECNFTVAKPRSCRDAPSLPEGLVSSFSSSLKRIVLAGIYYPWRVSTVTSIRDLRIGAPVAYYSSTEYGDTSSNFEDMLAALSRMSRLETLHLQGTLPPSGFAKLDQKCINLPRLRDVRLGGAVASCIALWERLNPDPHCSFSMSSMGLSENDFACAASRLSSHFSNEDRPAFRHMNFDITRGSLSVWLEMEMAPLNDKAILRDEHKPTFRLWLSPDNGRLERPFAVIACQLFTSLPIQHTHSLSLQGGITWSKAQTQEISERMQKLQYAKTYDGALHSFASVLLPQTPNFPQASADSPPLPSLAVLKMITEDMETAGNRMSGYGTNKPFYQELARILRIRRDMYGLALDLRIEKCIVQGQWVQQLMVVAHQARWDGAEGTRKRSPSSDDDWW